MEGSSARLMREIRASEGPEMLTPRETDVLHLVAEGKANKEIASSLGITEQIAKSHVHSILGKLGMLSRTQAAVYAAGLGHQP